ncbi:helix-turn-helix transcriptional regulator [Brevibacterium litoralis]|uniref:helix-turn-helix transcriptional regulator n=1 Tax=Brevibacterium litoralis TaxID=3138935 RepID=UPI0032EDA5FC
MPSVRRVLSSTPEVDLLVVTGPAGSGRMRYAGEWLDKTTSRCCTITLTDLLAGRGTDALRDASLCCDPEDSTDQGTSTADRGGTDRLRRGSEQGTSPAAPDDGPCGLLVDARSPLDRDRIEQALPAIDALRESSPGCHIAIVLGGTLPDPTPWRRRFAHVCGPADLMYTRDEIAALMAEHGEVSDCDVAELWRTTGGWSFAVARLAHLRGRDIAARSFELQPTTDTAWTSWLLSHPDQGALFAAGFLTSLDPEVMTTFASPTVPVATIQRLRTAGIVRGLEPENAFVPRLVRTALTGFVESASPEDARVGWLRSARAADSHGHFTEALRALHRLNDRSPEIVFSLGSWVHALTEEGNRALGDLQTYMPGWSESDDPEALVAGALASNVSGDSFYVHLTRSEHRSARRLADRYTDTLVPYDRTEEPTARHLNQRLALTAFQSMHCWFDEALASAEELAEISQAVPERSHLTLLAACGLVRAGLSFQLSGEPDRAFDAFEEAWRRATSTKNAFVTADAAGRLALWNALYGTRARCLLWLDRLAAALEGVTWGVPYLTRAGDLARIWMALEDLDPVSAEQVSAVLDDAMDTDEMWPVLAAARVRILSHSNQQSLAIRLSERYERERSTMLESVFARTLLAGARVESYIFAGNSARAQDAIKEYPPGASASAAYYSSWLGALIGDRTAARDWAGRAIDDPTCSERLWAKAAIMRQVVESPDPARAETLGAGIRDMGTALSTYLPAWYVEALRPGLVAGAGLTSEQVGRLDATVGRRFIPDEDRPELTQREVQIVRHMAQKMTRAQMAEADFVSVNTVKTIVRHIYRKLGVRSPQEAVTMAVTWGYV